MPTDRSRSSRSRFRRSASSRPARWRPGGWLFRAVLALLVLWLAACFLVVAEPTVNRPARADAILVLGPPDVDGRVTEAFALARQHYARTVVVSVESDAQLRAKSACRDDNPDYQVICFQPSPRTTQGEAEEIGRLAAQRHWRSIIVVTSKYHISRARLIVDRCVSGRVLMVAAPGRPSLTTWAYQFLYQTGAYVKAFIKRAC